jgi:hypothetical protein
MNIKLACLGATQLIELNRQLGGVRWLNSSFASGQEGSFDACMSEALDHA